VGWSFPMHAWSDGKMYSISHKSFKILIYPNGLLQENTFVISWLMRSKETFLTRWLEATIASRVFLLKSNQLFSFCVHGRFSFNEITNLAHLITLNASSSNLSVAFHTVTIVRLTRSATHPWGSKMILSCSPLPASPTTIALSKRFLSATSSRVHWGISVSICSWFLTTRVLSISIAPFCFNAVSKDQLVLVELLSRGWLIQYR